MISCTKAILIALYCAALTASVSGRESVADDATIGGAGAGSDGRQDKAESQTSSDVALFPADNSSSTVVIVVNNDEKEDEKDNDKNNDKDDKNNDKDDKDEDKNNDKDEDKNNDKDEDKNSETSNFGDTGTLADREVDVFCPICDAVSDHSYDAKVKVDVGNGQMWDCGYLQETVQDVDPNSSYQPERHGCRHAQRMAEMGGCCAKTMYVDTVGKDLNDACDLCGGDGVPSDNMITLVNTGVVGRHTCGDLEMVMKEGMFSSDRCPQIRDAVFSKCCNAPNNGWDFGWGWASQRSGTTKMALLRGGDR